MGDEARNWLILKNGPHVIGLFQGMFERNVMTFNPGWDGNAQKLATFTEHWSPKIIGRLNDYELKIVKVQGEFVWHQHDDTDEVFLVLGGELTIDVPDGAVVLGPQETVTIPRGVRHRPRAATETSLLLIEPAGVVNTGEAGGEMTATPESLI
jgi:mannose-6-phosphate isomerase-like protein (cupin superfamily)